MASLALCPHHPSFLCNGYEECRLCHPELQFPERKTRIPRPDDWDCFNCSGKQKEPLQGYNFQRFQDRIPKGEVCPACGQGMSYYGGNVDNRSTTVYCHDRLCPFHMEIGLIFVPAGTPCSLCWPELKLTADQIALLKTANVTTTNFGFFPSTASVKMPDGFVLYQDHQNRLLTQFSKYEWPELLGKPVEHAVQELARCNVRGIVIPADENTRFAMALCPDVARVRVMNGIVTNVPVRG